MPKIKNPLDPSVISQYENFDEFIEEFYGNGRERAQVILATNILEEGLSLLISNFLIDDPKCKNIFNDSNGPLNTFCQKIHMAYFLGLISQEEMDNLDIIRIIRNAFAHQMHGISFDSQEIRDLCKNFIFPDSTTKIEQNPHKNFIKIFFTLRYILDSRAKHVLSIRLKRTIYGINDFFWGDPPQM